MDNTENSGQVRKRASVSQYLDYIKDERGKAWILKDYSDNRGVWVSNSSMFMCSGNAYDAMVLAQVLFWSGIQNDEKSGQSRPRISHIREDHYWIVKTYDEFAKEIGIKSGETVKNCMERLANNDLIIRETHKSPFTEHKGSVVSFTRMNWFVFGDFLDQWIQVSDEQSGYKPEPEQGYQPYPGKGSEPFPDKGYQPYPRDTENTTENTNKDKTSITPAAAATPSWDPNIETVSDEEEDQERTALSLLIAMAYPKKPSYLTETQEIQLSRPVTAIIDVAISVKLPSPNELYETRSLFKKFCKWAIEQQKAYASKSNNANVRASKTNIVNHICGYNRADGWLWYEEQNKNFDEDQEFDFSVFENHEEE